MMVFATVMSTVQFYFMLAVAAFVAGGVPLLFMLDWYYRKRRHLADGRSPRARKLFRLVALANGAVGCGFVLLSLMLYDVLPQWEGAFFLGLIGAFLVAAGALLALLQHMFPGLFWLLIGR